jgi:ABC-type bacteriocin/lantibiotic exporter with double-glycine peptidase domain/CRP-like cAMP-binding protein
VTGSAREVAPAQGSLLDLLAADDRARLTESCDRVEFSFGQVVVRQGDAADSAYVLVEGRARVVRRKEDGQEVVLGSLRPGDVFGEIALLKHGQRTATVRASGDVVVLRLPRDRFERLIEERNEIGRWLGNLARGRLLGNFLRSTPSFQRLPAAVIGDLIQALEPVEYRQGEKVIRQGDPPGAMFLVESGKLRAHTSPQPGVLKNLAFLREGDAFGEGSLLRHQARRATVEAVTDVRLLRLGHAAFQRLLATWPEFRRAVEEHVAAEDGEHEANVPLDFAQEILPAGARLLTVPEPDVGGEEHATARERPEHPFEDAAGLFRRRRPRRRFSFVSQIDEMDCGAACLAMVCRYFGKRISLARIRQLTNTATDGTSIRNICHAATELGLAARTAKVSRDNVEGMPLPAIVHWKGFHWVVAVEIRRDRVRIADPAAEVYWLPRADFDANWTGFAALFDYLEAFAQAPEARPSFAWIYQHLRPFRSLAALVLGLSLVSACLTLVLPVLSQVVVDRIVVEGMAELLGVVVGTMMVVFVVQTLSNALESYLLAFATVRIDAGILDFLTRKLLTLPLGYFQARRTGDIQRRMDGGREIREAILTNGMSGLLAVVQLVVAVALMTIYSRPLTLAFLAVVPLYVGLMVVSVRLLRPLLIELEEKVGKHRSEQLDAIKGIEAVKVSSAESAFRERLLGQFIAVARSQARADYFIFAYRSAIATVGFLASTLFLWFGARLAVSGQLTLGGFVAFNSLVLLANAPLATILGLWDEWQHLRVILDRLTDVLEHQPEQGHDRSRLLPVRSLSGRVELRNVSFRFGGADSPWILRDIDLEVAPGSTVAIVGRSGSGKTTLARLIGGLMDPTEGTILFDGIESKSLNYRDLRRRMGFVLQETHIFNATILENIAFGEDPDPDRVVSAARAAAAAEFIERLPLGYDTVIGESGIGLSGGQRQRIAIARALYREPPILVLDEATSALDTESEQAVQESIREQLGKRTIFVIAHRLSTVRDADEVIVLDRGEIVERGTHDSLMDRRGVYFCLVSRQVEA